jgi:hypothetical protein
MLDSDLAELYGVETKILNRAVKRNLERFPKDFMFQLNYQELGRLRFQNGTSKTGNGSRQGRWFTCALNKFWTDSRRFSRKIFGKRNAILPISIFMIHILGRGGVFTHQPPLKDQGGAA